MFHPVSEIFLYILFVSFVTKQKWVYNKKKVSVSLLHFISPCFETSTDQGVWTVSSCFVANEMNETDHQWELLLVCFICFILFQSILEYSLYILIVSSVSVKDKKTCPKKTCVVFVQYMFLGLMTVILAHLSWRFVRWAYSVGLVCSLSSVISVIHCQPSVIIHTLNQEYL